jgi:GTP-binding protein
MRIVTAEFKKSLVEGYAEYNADLPEIALVGRSNVGKSSLINFLTDQTKLAKVSKNPGKTKLVNYFLLNGTWYLVDLPGYGYANVSKQEQELWDARMGGYFEQSKMLKAVLILIDIRREPSPHDIAMMEYANYYGIPYVIIATKADKIAKSKRKNACAHMCRILQKYGCREILPISAEGDIGKEELLALMEKLCFGERENQE